MEIFIKPLKKASLTHKSCVRLKDAAEVYVAGGDQAKVENITMLNIDADRNGRYIISALDMVKKTAKLCPEAGIQCMGETETLIVHKAKKEKYNRILDIIKTAFVCIVLFGGAMTAIMSFHSDAQMPAVFQNIGLAVGIIVFFNHFGLKKITEDPTPIEVEMTTYEKESDESVIDRLEKEKNNGSS